MKASKHQKELVLPKGSHVFHFETEIPPNCPSSFEGSHGHIRYKVKLIFVHNILWDKGYSCPFTVINSLNLNHYGSNLWVSLSSLHIYFLWALLKRKYTNDTRSYLRFLTRQDNSNPFKNCITSVNGQTKQLFFQKSPKNTIRTSKSQTKSGPYLVFTVHHIVVFSLTLLKVQETCPIDQGTFATKFSTERINRVDL